MLSPPEIFDFRIFDKRCNATYEKPLKKDFLYKDKTLRLKKNYR